MRGGVRGRPSPPPRTERTIRVIASVDDDPQGEPMQRAPGQRETPHSLQRELPSREREAPCLERETPSLELKETPCPARHQAA